MSDPGWTEVTTRIGEVLDELQSLPPDAFAERSALRGELDRLGVELAGFNTEEAEAIKKRWAEQAGAKGPEDDGVPFVYEPTDNWGGVEVP